MNFEQLLNIWVFSDYSLLAISKNLLKRLDELGLKSVENIPKVNAKIMHEEKENWHKIISGETKQRKIQDRSEAESKVAQRKTG